MPCFHPGGAGLARASCRLSVGTIRPRGGPWWLDRQGSAPRCGLAALQNKSSGWGLPLVGTGLHFSLQTTPCPTLVFKRACLDGCCHHRVLAQSRHCAQHSAPVREKSAQSQVWNQTAGCPPRLQHSPHASHSASLSRSPRVSVMLSRTSRLVTRIQ